MRLNCAYILALFSFGQIAHAQENAAPQSSTILADRYQIIQSELAAKWTFRLDRICGSVSQLVSTKDESLGWQAMPIDKLPPCQPNGRPSYQLFTSGLAVRHTFLMNTSTGKTWTLVDRSGEATWSEFER
jgi:hypothetical protein